LRVERRKRKKKFLDGSKSPRIKTRRATIFFCQERSNILGRRKSLSGGWFFKRKTFLDLIGSFLFVCCFLLLYLSQVDTKGRPHSELYIARILLFALYTILSLTSTITTSWFGRMH